jgi:hypothetical protein
MNWWNAFKAAMTVYGAVTSKQESDRQADDQERAAIAAEDLGRQNAAAAESELQETMRRTKRDQSAKEGTARARAAASGIKGGSMTDAITGLITEHGRQLDWMKRSGKAQQEIILAGGAGAAAVGRSAASATRAKGTAGLLKDTGDVYSSGKQAGWWSTT